MKQLLIGLIFLLPSLGFADAKVDLQQAIAQLTTFKAHFEQSIFSSEGPLLQRTEGVVAVCRPDRFRWEVTKGGLQTILIKGDEVSTYDPDLEQLTIQSLSSLSSAPVLLLTGQSDKFMEQFSIKEEPADSTFVLTAKDDNALVRMVQLNFEDGKLTTLTFVNPLDQITRVLFTNIRQGNVCAQRDFSLDIPETTDVIRMEKA